MDLAHCTPGGSNLLRDPAQFGLGRNGPRVHVVPGGTRAKSQHIFYGDVPVLTGKLAFDISNIVISNLVYANPRAGQSPPEYYNR